MLSMVVRFAAYEEVFSNIIIYDVEYVWCRKMWFSTIKQPKVNIQIHNMYCKTSSTQFSFTHEMCDLWCDSISKHLETMTLMWWMKAPSQPLTNASDSKQREMNYISRQMSPLILCIYLIHMFEREHKMYFSIYFYLLLETIVACALCVNKSNVHHDKKRPIWYIRYKGKNAFTFKICVKDKEI